MVDNDDGVVLDHAVEQGNPPDAPQLAPAVAGVKKPAGSAPGTVTADRGYDEANVDRQLTDLGVTNVVIPRRGKPSQARRRGTSKGVPPHSQMANRGRRQDQLPQTRLRLGPRPPPRYRRCPDLDRTRGPRPQPGQDQRACRIAFHRTGQRRSRLALPPAPTHTQSDTADFFRSK